MSLLEIDSADLIDRLSDDQIKAAFKERGIDWAEGLKDHDLTEACKDRGIWPEPDVREFDSEDLIHELRERDCDVVLSEFDMDEARVRLARNDVPEMLIHLERALGDGFARLRDRVEAYARTFVPARIVIR